MGLEIAKNWLPPPRLSISDWADKYRTLSPESSSEPGKWSTDRAPYQRGFMDALKEEGINTVVLMTSSQVGKTEAINNILGYYIHLDPCPILLIQPTLELAESYSKDRLAPMRRDCEVLSERIKDPRSRDSGNGLLHKNFPGGHISLAGANSAASLASRPIRILLCDEVDRYPVSAGTEGDPVRLAQKRTTTFWNRKIILVSSPTIEGASRIYEEYKNSDQRKYLVPCPHCGHYQELVWERVIFEKNNPLNACYGCLECGREIAHQCKNEMLRLGRWQATREKHNVAGFAISELYSPWSTWGDVAASYLNSVKDPQLLQVWFNTTLGLPFKRDEGDKLSWEKLIERAISSGYRTGEIPEGVELITCGIDVQGDRLEVSVWGWGFGEESWLIAHEQILGNPSEEVAWDLLDRFLDLFDLSAVCVDSGYKTQDVYSQVRKRKKKRWYAVKGVSGARPLISRPSYQEINYRGKVLKRGIQLYPIGVDLAKSTLYARSQILEIGAKYQHYPEDIDSCWFEGFCSEVQVKKYKNGVPYYCWERIAGVRNEVLDCAVYALCGAHLAGVTRLKRTNKDVRLNALKEQSANVEENQLENSTRKSALNETNIVRKNNWINKW